MRGLIAIALITLFSVSSCKLEYDKKPSIYIVTIFGDSSSLSLNEGKTRFTKNDRVKIYTQGSLSVMERHAFLGKGSNYISYFGQSLQSSLGLTSDVVIVSCIEYDNSVIDIKNKTKIQGSRGPRVKPPILSSCTENTQRAIELTGGTYIGMIFIEAESEVFKAADKRDEGDVLDYSYWEEAVLAFQEEFGTKFGSSNILLVQGGENRLYRDESFAIEWQRMSSFQKDVSINHNLPLVETSDLEVDESGFGLSPQANVLLGQRLGTAFYMEFLAP